MVIRSTGDLKDPIIKEHVDSLQAESFQNALPSIDTPIATAPVLEDNEWGYDGTNIWFRIGSTLLKVTPDESITIT